MSLVSQVTEVRTLQEIDDEVATVRAAIEDVERRLRGNPELDQARRDFATAQSELQDAQRVQRRLDGDVAGLNARIQPEEKRLYDGSVRNPKELSNIQHEVELLKEQRSKLEDQLLDVMSRLEVAEREFSAAEKRLLQWEARWENEQTELRHELKKLGDLLARDEAKREIQKPKVNPRVLALYEEVRKRRGGVAVAHIQGGNCGGCRVQIPEAIRRRAFSADQVAQCPNCERLLYVG